MVCPFRAGWFLCTAACFLWFTQPFSGAQVAETEQRDFSLLVDGKEAGLARYTITVENDGTTMVAVHTNLKVSQFIFHYTYTVDITESWKNDKLIRLKATCVDNGKHTDVEGTSDGTQLKMRINGHERLVSAEAWTSSFWKLADPKYHNKAIPILEPDVGKDYTGQLLYVGTEQLTLLNQPQSCYHFRVTGGSYPVEVWFDRYHRLVRQEFVDSGHKTIMQLIGLKR